MIPLGHRTVTGTPDITGANPGNWTVTFDANALNVNVPYFEVYHIDVNGAPGTTFTIFIDLAFWDQSNNGFLNAWDPNQPMILRPGETVYVYYSDNVSDGTPPVVTLWLRYDEKIPVNQHYTAGA